MGVLQLICKSQDKNLPSNRSAVLTPNFFPGGEGRPAGAGKGGGFGWVFRKNKWRVEIGEDKMVFGAEFVREMTDRVLV
ncbi:MAG: hypothetical protein JRG79_11025 [Deltaproteobacteria bacterium]|nr:hypothetical protein [Deltaproteobacteria bacterium]